MRKIDTHDFILATRATPREINRQILLNLVWERQPISRADLARCMGVRRGMITAMVDELLTEGAIYEGATVDAPRGRRPQMLHLRTHDRIVVAADVRFSRTTVMIADFAGRTLAQDGFATMPHPDALVAEISTLARRLLVATGSEQLCEGVGLVVPGAVDQSTGRVLNSPQLGWRDVDVRTPLAAAMLLPVFVENAPVACALAHLWLGGRGGTTPADFVYVTVSDGVGAGIVVNGAVVRGHAHTAGEFGHAPIAVDGPRCLCGAVGCLEAFTSNLATLARYLGHEFSPDAARGLLAESGLTVDDVIARSQAGEARAIAAIDETARYLGVGIASLVSTLNPSHVYIGGEITEVWDRVGPVLTAAVRARALTTAAATTKIVPEPASPPPRLRGATALVAARMLAAPRVA